MNDRFVSWCLIFGLLITMTAPTAGAAQPSQTKKLKIYISVDMEGVAGAVTDDQLGPNSFEYARFREFMTREALAAVTAAKEAGASEIVISDSHGNGENLLIELFPKDVRIIRAWPRKLAMMAGIDNAEVRARLGDIEAAEVKKSLGFHSANTLTPEASYELIGQKVKAALHRFKDFKPYTVKTPVTLEVGFKHYRPVEVLSYLKGVDRIDSHTIRFQGKDMLDLSDFMVFLTNYSIVLEP